MGNNIKNRFANFRGKETSFCNLLISSKKYKELYNLKRIEVIVGVISSIAFTRIIYYIGMTNITGLNESIKNICLYLGSSLVGLLGFVIAGLSILTGTLGFSIAKKIDDENKANSIVGIFFSFHFIGMIIGIQIVLFFFSYFIMFIEKDLSIKWLLILSIVLSYLFTFSIFYSIGLLGTCLRMFLINYKYNDKLTREKEILKKEEEKGL